MRENRLIEIVKLLLMRRLIESSVYVCGFVLNAMLTLETASFSHEKIAACDFKHFKEILILPRTFLSAIIVTQSFAKITLCDDSFAAALGQT